MTDLYYLAETEGPWNGVMTGKSTEQVGPDHEEPSKIVPNVHFQSIPSTRGSLFPDV